ncbi:MAG: hypothetical protein WA885_22155 [Phormidesmis sp.]
MQLDIRLDLTLPQVRLHLLEGLDSWVRLGLISDEQVRRLAAKLSDPLPAAAEAIQPERVRAAPSPPPVVREVGKLSRAMRTLLDEISVIWLLFLGVFLVVVSSGVLAARQWQSFSAVGQYAILFGYTLAFWGAAGWAKRQAQLQATARMLVLTTLLLIPVNFWMMDTLGVLDSAAGKGFGGMSAIALSLLPLKLLTERSNRLNLIALSWLHWGWVGSSLLGLVGNWALWPVVATYLGTVGTAANLTYQDRQSMAAERSVETGSETESTGTNSAEVGARSRILSFDVLAVALAILILLFRSLFVAQVPPHQLGLAAGICGWLLAWLNRDRVSQALWQWAGFSLLLLGWIVSVEQPFPWQAIGVSGLALLLLWNRLRRSWQKGYLLALIGVAGQAYWLLGAMVPPGTRDTVLTRLSSQLSAQPIVKSEWTSLGFFPFLLGLLWLAWWFRRWQQRSLSETTEGAALILGGGLTLLSLTNPFTAAANLLLSTILLFVVVRRRPQIPAAMVALTHGVGLLALAAWIDYLRPGLSLRAWADVGLSVAVAEFGAHLALRSDRAQRSTWRAGLGLFALSYWPLIEGWPQPSWVWLVAPVTLTFAANHRRALVPQGFAKAAAVALLLQTPWLTSWPIAIASFAVGSFCSGLNSRIWRSYWSAMFAVGSGVALVTSILCYGVLERATNVVPERLLVFWVVEICGLWLVQRALNRRSDNLSRIHEKAVQSWGWTLMAWFLLYETFVAVYLLSEPLYSSDITLFYTVAAAVLLIAALLESIRYRPAEWRYWSLAWAVLVTVWIGVVLRGGGLGAVAIATLSLGLTSQIMGDLWRLRRSANQAWRFSWHGIPVVYAIVGLLCGHNFFVADSGLYTLVAAVIFLGVGRRRASLQALSYVGLAGISIGAYELLVYRLLQASGGQPGDGMTLLAALAMAIALIERLAGSWLTRYLKISAKGLLGVTHTHWAVGSLGIVIAAVDGLSQPRGISIWTVTALLLAAYALTVGNRRWTSRTVVLTAASWTTLGLTEALLCVAYGRFVWFFDRSGLFTWGGLIACAIGFGLYRAPWQRWGWPAKPWQRLGLWLPMLTLSITLSFVQNQSLLIVGAFYAWMAKLFGKVRISYLSIFLFDWALLRYLNQQGILNELWISLTFGLSMLYVIEIDSQFREVSRRQQRHTLRILALGLIGLTSLYQADTADSLLAYAGLTIALSTVSIFAGLIFKTRAFLYIGTATFILQIIRVLWLAIDGNSSLLWAVGIALGLLFIWVAATFESRRSQVINLLESWSTALATWD